jgi:S1-C subfamily serine protease
MSYFWKLPTVIIGTAIVVIQAGIELGSAQVNSEAVGKIAQQITVLIDGQNPGTGVIIAKKDNTYYVLTAGHVVATEDEYEIVTLDLQRYRLNYSTVKKLPNVDLAILEFKSDRNYSVAKLGNSDEVNLGSAIHIYGFPNPGREITKRIPQFTSGQVSSRPETPLRDGYAIVYPIFTRAGMSGGPVLNDRGELVGIHGRAEGEAETNAILNESGNSSSEKIGLNLGIPINTFKDLASQVNFDLSLLNQSPGVIQKPIVQPLPVVAPNPTGIPSRPPAYTPTNPGSTCVGASRNC